MRRTDGTFAGHLGRTGAAALAFLAVSAGEPAAAPATSVNLEYDAFVLGFPAVTFDFRLDQSEALYHVEGTIHTNGVADLVVSYRLETHTDGRVVAGSLQPIEQANQSKRNGVERLVRLDYDGGAVRAHATPPFDKTLPPEQTAGTLDPASATLAAGRALAATGRCDQRIKVFDGRRRYDLVLADDGEGRLERGIGLYTGPAHRCRLEMIKIDEVQREESETKSEPAVVWFASLDPLLPPLPVRIDFTSHWGLATVALTRVQPVSTVAGARP